MARVLVLVINLLSSYDARFVIPACSLTNMLTIF